MILRYLGLIDTRREDLFLVPTIGYCSVSGVASAAAYAIWFHFNAEGVDLDRDTLKQAALDALHMDQHIHDDCRTIFPKCYFGFSVEEGP